MRADDEPSPPRDLRATAAARFEAEIVPEIPVLWRAARAITGDATEAEDLAQDTLLRAYRALATFDGAHPRSWLLTIMRNTHINRNRRRRPGLTPTGEIPEDPARAAPSAEDSATRALLDADLDRALAGLSPKLARVVELVDVGGLSYAEAAAALGVPPGTVMSRLHRARRQVRAALPDRTDGDPDTQEDPGTAEGGP